MWGAAPPAPAPGGRADGAGLQGSAGRAPGCPHLRAVPPAGRGRVPAVAHPLCGAAQAQAAARVLCPRPRLGRAGAPRCLVLRGYCGRSAADRIKLAGSGGRRGDYTQSGSGPGGRVVAEGYTLPGHRLCLLWCRSGRQARGSWREGGRGKEARRCWVTGGESQSPPPPRPCRPPAPARTGQRPPGATSESGKSPGWMLRDSAPRSLGKKGGVRNEGRLKGRTRQSAGLSPPSP